jgi:hypothetical protein
MGCWFLDASPHLDGYQVFRFLRYGQIDDSRSHNGCEISTGRSGTGLTCFSHNPGLPRAQTQGIVAPYGPAG